MPTTNLRIDWNGYEYAASPWDTDAHMALLDEIDAALDGALTTPREAAARLTKALKDDPAWIDGWLERATLHDDMFDNKASQTDRRRAFDIATAAIPADCMGPLPWGHVPNRPVLRAIAAWSVERAERQDYAEAAKLARRLLKLNPNDNQGMRLILGPALLRSGAPDAAMQSLQKTASEDPGMRHELALLQFERMTYVEAVTTLRRAMIENPYIADTLLTGRTALPMPLSQGSNTADYDGAKSYTDLWGERWTATGGALPFLRWVQTHPRLMAERAKALAPNERLLWEKRGPTRAELVKLARRKLDAVDDELSGELVADDAPSGDRRRRPWDWLQKRRDEHASRRGIF